MATFNWQVLRPLVEVAVRTGKVEPTLQTLLEFAGLSLEDAQSRLQAEAAAERAAKLGERAKAEQAKMIEHLRSIKLTATAGEDMPRLMDEYDLSTALDAVAVSGQLHHDAAILRNFTSGVVAQLRETFAFDDGLYVKPVMVDADDPSTGWTIELGYAKGATKQEPGTRASHSVMYDGSPTTWADLARAAGYTGNFATAEGSNMHGVRVLAELSAPPGFTWPEKCQPSKVTFTGIAQGMRKRAIAMGFRQEEA